MHNFLSNNREDLVLRCKSKVAQRPRRAATEQQLANGVPLFLDQLIRTLAAEEADNPAVSIKISGPAGGEDSTVRSEMGVSATAHGKELLDLGYSVDQVVHDYGDLCQAITDLAFELDAPFSVAEFRTLNRCLDNAIAGAVTEFSLQRDVQLARQQSSEANERLGFLVHELRNALGTATLAIHALEVGSMPIGGATGAVLKRSVSMMGTLIGRAIAEVRSGLGDDRQTFSVASFIVDAGSAAQLFASTAGCALEVLPVDPSLGLRGNRELLLGALANLLQNAFKFTRPHTRVTLKAYASGDEVLIEVEDRCGGLPPGSEVMIFTPFHQYGLDRSGLGLGLSIARQSIEADAGTLTVRDLPDVGCVFTIRLARHALPLVGPEGARQGPRRALAHRRLRRRRLHTLHTPAPPASATRGREARNAIPQGDPMSKGQRGNKEAKKPKKAPGEVKVQAPPPAEVPATARAILAPKPGKR